MNDIFGEKLFSAEAMFMNHSPMRSYLSKFSNEPGVLMVSGSLRIIDILEDLGISNYVTADELYALFHKGEREVESDGQLLFHERTYQAETIISRLQGRLKLSSLPSNYHEWGQIINSFFMLNDISPYETTLEVIHNVFAEKQKRGLPLPPYFAAQNDIVWQAGYHRPRLAFGPFNYMLEEHCQRHQFPLTKRYFGKPEREAFQFVEDCMRQRHGDGCFFMVGDNPRGDICGANRIGWASFLTQTGVHHGQANDPENPATQVVLNFQEAAEVVLRIKRDRLYI
jgi:ribonucleotide monophosphatase NagD (HAD superfamily)